MTSIDPATTSANGTASAAASAATPVPSSPRVAIWVGLGIAALSAAVTYAIVRTTMARATTDPTAERIQDLIDEANRLLRTIDEAKRS